MSISTSKKNGMQLVESGELDKVPPGYWAAVVNGKVVAWAKSLQDLLSIIMERRGYKRSEYAVIKVPPDELLIA